MFITNFKIFYSFFYTNLMVNKGSISSQKIFYYQMKLLQSIIIKMLTKRVKKGKMEKKAIKNPKKLERETKLIFKYYKFKTY